MFLSGHFKGPPTGEISVGPHSDVVEHGEKKEKDADEQENKRVSFVTFMRKDVISPQTLSPL